MKKPVLWITRTAIFIALLIIAQLVTASFGSTLVTGSVVNLILIVSVMTCGLSSGLTVAAVSPVLAKLIGIGPFWVLIPFIAAGNMILVLIWHFLGNKTIVNKYVSYGIAMVTAAAAKFVFLFLTIAKFAIPVLLKLPEPKASVIANLFSVPQLITALIGGAIAIAILPVLKKAIKSDK